MKNIANIKVTDRILNLREYYLNNSPMSVNRDLTPWHCHRTRLLYLEGYAKADWYKASTLRMRFSLAERYLLSNMKPVIIKGELITGQPDLHPFTEEEKAKFWEHERKSHMMPVKRGRDSHLAMDYELLLKEGIDGILKLLNKKIEELDLENGLNTEKYEYYTCCIEELEGLKTLAQNYADEALRLAQSSKGNEKEEYLALYETLKQVPIHPARSFREALQAVHTYTWSLFDIYSYGKVDYFLYPYYKHDIDNGVITKEQAQELVDSFILQSISNMSAWAAEGLMLGGRDKDGKPVENELTWHFLNAITHTRLPDPNIGFCVTDQTSEDIFNFAVKVIKSGNAQPSIWNSDAVTRSMIKNGYEAEHANMFTLSTCVEVTPIGCSGVSITSPYINLLKIFLQSFEKCDNNTSFEEIFETFKADFKIYAKKEMLNENLWQLERRRNGRDPMRASVLIHDCIEKGNSHDSGAAKYNFIEPNILGMQNTSESLNCIYRLVFKDKKLTLEDFKEALKENYEGKYEELRTFIINKIAHFGTSDGISNKIQKGVSNMVLETFSGMTTVRGAKVIPGAFSYRDHEMHGRNTSASPDGRKEGMPLNDGSCPVQGYDDKGPTLSLMSTASWEPSRFLGGTSVNVQLNEDTSEEKIAALIKGYLKTEGAQLQFNIVNVETLKDAQKNPEKHRDLLVRIGGYSDFFVKIPKGLQDEIISRTHNKF